MSSKSRPNPQSSPLVDSLAALGVRDLDIDGILTLALARGGDLSELFFEATRSTRVFYEGGKVDRVLSGNDRGVGLRIIFDGKQVYGYSTDVTQPSLEKLARALSLGVTMKLAKPAPARTTARDWRKPPETTRPSNPRIRPADVELGRRIELTERMDRAVRQLMPEVRQVTAICIDSTRNILTVNSDGLFAPDERIITHAYVQLVGEKDGRVETALESDGGAVGFELFDERTPEDFAGEAVRRLKVLLDAKPAPAGTMAVVMAAEAGGTMIHEAVGHGLEADLACEGQSVYEGKLGKLVASPLVTVIDDGTIPDKRGSFAYDDEGNRAQKNVLVENGVLKGYMVDRLSAMKFDLMVTGNGRRESFRHLPMVRMTNTYIAPGTEDPAQILKDTKQGIYVRGMGGGQVDTVSGDFVFAVTEGYLIQDGKLGAAIRGATLVGNGPKALMQIDRVGNDLGYATGTCGKNGQGAPVTDAQPTLRIPELTVGGEVPMSEYWKD